MVKENGILAGMELAALIFKKVDERIVMNPFLRDGDAISIGDIAFTIEGPSSSLLTAERLVLNCMQRMSGIATKTHEINKLIEGTKAKGFRYTKNNSWHSITREMGS